MKQSVTVLVLKLKPPGVWAFFEMTGFGFGLVDVSRHQVVYETPGSVSGLKLWLRLTYFR